MIFASNNKGKIKEIKNILKEYKITSMKENNIQIDIIEDEDTFYENALKKAKEIYKITGIPTIADDSGLCIDALNNWPGVETHRLLGENHSDKERNNYILEKMRNPHIKERTAHVVCCLIYHDGTNTIMGEGVLDGTISTKRRGKNGFGFDEIFELKNGKTLAEITKEEKNKISARSLAAIDLKEKLDKIRR
ncbi:MAG: RdgB/HAM1 family non-canonical purine NTP pyrophosphatase [Bacilli bacterium]|nr:RdgB/HAM1 family non-canonical purine NTP pyrophosphatase [Bacilli bacterium]